MDEKLLNEAEICDSFITPAIIRAGWEQRTQVRREYTFTSGREVARPRLKDRASRRMP